MCACIRSKPPASAPRNKKTSTPQSRRRSSADSDQETKSPITNINVAVAAVVNGLADSPVTVHLDGGDLTIEVSPDLDVRLTGPVERILRGDFDQAFVRELERIEDG